MVEAALSSAARAPLHLERIGQIRRTPGAILDESRNNFHRRDRIFTIHGMDAHAGLRHDGNGQYPSEVSSGHHEQESLFEGSLFRQCAQAFQRLGLRTLRDCIFPGRNRFCPANRHPARSLRQVR